MTSYFTLKSVPERTLLDDRFMDTFSFRHIPLIEGAIFSARNQKLIVLGPSNTGNFSIMANQVTNVAEIHTRIGLQDISTPIFSTSGFNPGFLIP